MTLDTSNYAQLSTMLEDLMVMCRVEATVLIRRYRCARTQRKKRQILDHARRFSVIRKVPEQLKWMEHLINLTNADCIAKLRMDCHTFGKLCRILKERGGLTVGNRAVGFEFWRSGGTVSYYVNKVLGAVLSLHSILLSKPTPVPEDCTDHRWRWFKGCLGALDGTHINVLVSGADKPRYRTRKGQIATNTLAVCDRHMQFVYLLPGWEGSAGDSRVLRDANQGGGSQFGNKVPLNSLHFWRWWISV
ncbi:uncharacterized protein LOC125222437 isoform X2 [Salvia hispanica]|uniref:uncharacterized protein LOC125222437 isoform X2 n=1 Tax=Salvia hispanica TaxID=49212 RepID=UPI0020095390|nr:uncharacterized protein LOC125222437 isoform X2 [Salvia hispanica]